MFCVIVGLPCSAGPHALSACVDYGLSCASDGASGIDRIFGMGKRVCDHLLHRNATLVGEHEPVVNWNRGLIHLGVVNLTNARFPTG